MFMDLKWLLGVEIEHTAVVHPKRITPEEEGEIYFKDLKKSWS
jgi:hypothetical protein